MTNPTCPHCGKEMREKWRGNERSLCLEHCLPEFICDCYPPVEGCAKFIQSIVIKNKEGKEQ